MSKILQTQLTGIFNRLEDQALDIQMAAQCLIQAIGGEGYVYINGYGDLKFFETFILESDEKLNSSKKLSELNSLNDLDTTDRVFLFSPFYTKEVAQDVQQLIDKDIDFVLVCNRPKQKDFPEHLMHFVNLSTPRPIVYTEDYDKIVQPHTMAFNYIYYDIYTQMIEMTRDLEL
ncbi:DUF2529 domain-containing protein [Staphylococcus hominis]|uniref:DUF2529 domain-containing protein n=1 Tax=Staphylococcus hominis TaxID=1290 RepID=UPI0012DF7E14|nr:DUF2529 domain-containing protein [Staphylococcus hominis]MDS0980200.1 DUF2529 domain-containing protein [Staphylococcus hominis]QGR80057.1 DUF2529 family protein [Staphylococcus hominis]